MTRMERDDLREGQAEVGKAEVPAGPEHQVEQHNQEQNGGRCPRERGEIENALPPAQRHQDNHHERGAGRHQVAPHSDRLLFIHLSRR